MPIPDKFFNPSRSFLSLPIVRITFYFAISFAGLASLTIIVSSNLSPDFTSDGFNHFLSIFRFPLGVVALLIPIMAIYATNHRSVQQRQQIQLAGEQNNFINYYKHLEEFQKHFSGFWLRFEILQMRQGLTPNNYHRLFYNNSRSGNYQVSRELYDKQLSTLLLIIEKLRLIDSSEDPIRRREHFILAENGIRNFCSNMHLNYFGRISEYRDGKIITPSGSYGPEPIKEAIEALQEGIHFFIHLSQFAHEPTYKVFSSHGTYRCKSPL